MSPGWVANHLDVVEHITSGFFLVNVDPAAYPFPLQQPEVTLRHGVVVTIASAALAGVAIPPSTAR
jgi:hypothetical protein